MAYKYNPGFLSDQDSIRDFVVRQKDLGIIREVLRENSSASSNRHVLIVGPRGSGKTTLVRRLVADMRTDPSLSKSWYPILLGEESYTIATAGEFWLECVFHLAEQLPERDDLQTAYQQLQSETDDVLLREKALGILVNFAAQQNKRLALIVENFNMIIEDQMNSEEGWAIRHSLHNVPEVMLVATATKKFEKIESEDEALYEQFKVHELRPLVLSDISTLWKHFTEVKLPPKKARPIQILTGGSPRLITILADFAVDHSLKNLMDRLATLIDQYTDYFKSQLDALAATERKVFVAVLEKWDPSTTRDIADDARVPVNQTSSLLNRLKQKGSVRRKSMGGTQYWEAAERLFNLFYLMRRRGAPSSRVAAFVKFMTIYYEHDQLYDQVAEIAKECRSIDPLLRQDHYSVLKQIWGTIDEAHRASLLDMIPSDIANELQVMPHPQKTTGRRKNGGPSEMETKVFNLLRTGKVDEAIAMLRSGGFEDKKFSDVWALVGFASSAIDTNRDQSESLFGMAEALEPASSLVPFFRGLIDVREKRPHDAIRHYREAIDGGRNDSPVWTELGDAYEMISKPDEAESAFRRAIKLDSKNPYAWYSLGSLLASEQRDLNDAEAAFRKAVKLQPDDITLAGGLGSFLLEERNKAEEAASLFRAIWERHPDHTFAASQLIRALSRAHKPREEIDAIFDRVANAADIKTGWHVSSAYADYLNTIHEHDLAEKVLRDATIAYPHSSEAWLSLARHLAVPKVFDEQAVDAFRRSIELDPNSPRAWVELGEYFSKKAELAADAEKSLRKATEIGPNMCASWRALGDHLLRDGRTGEASDCYKRAFEVNPNCTCAIGGYASILAKADSGLTRVREMLDAFIQRMPENPYPHIVLSEYALSLGRDREEAIRQLLLALRKGVSPVSLAEKYIDTLDLEDQQASIGYIQEYISIARGRARNTIAWSLFKRKAVGALLDFALSTSKDAVEESPTNWGARHTLASLLGLAKRKEELLREVGWLSDNLDSEYIGELIELCTFLVRQGYGRDLEDILSKSKSKSSFEPLLVALQMMHGEEPNVALEVLEVARDIHRQFVEEPTPSRNSELGRF